MFRHQPGHLLDVAIAGAIILGACLLVAMLARGRWARVLWLWG